MNLEKKRERAAELFFRYAVALRFVSFWYGQLTAMFVFAILPMLTR